MNKEKNNYPWGHSRPFNAYVNHLKEKFGGRIQKLSVNAGFSCPNRDGTCGIGGCTYCDNSAFSPPYVFSQKSITEQLEDGKSFHRERYKTPRFFAYFQSFSNTYADIEVLRSRFAEALSVHGVEGLVIGTRPDCIDEQKLEMLAKFAENNEISIEYGIESCYNSSLQRINRGHSFETSVKALELTKKYNIDAGAHFIFGLPGETHQQMMDMVHVINELPLKTIKFHQLQIIKGTRMAKEFAENPRDFPLFLSADEYISFLTEFLTKLNPAFFIDRFAGEVNPAIVDAPNWEKMRYDQMVVRMEKTLIEKGWSQGCFSE